MDIPQFAPSFWPGFSNWHLHPAIPVNLQGDVIQVGSQLTQIALNFLVLTGFTGWWLTYPSEKYEFVSWDDEIPNIWKNKKCSNHQPVQICSFALAPRTNRHPQKCISFGEQKWELTSRSLCVEQVLLPKSLKYWNILQDHWKSMKIHENPRQRNLFIWLTHVNASSQDPNIGVNFLQLIQII